MEEEIKQDNKQDSKVPENTGGIRDFRDEEGKFLPGNTIGEKKKGSISIMTKIKQYLREHPEKLTELVDYYLNDLDMRDLLLRMVDGQPRQKIGVGLIDEDEQITKLTFELVIDRKQLNEQETEGNKSLPSGAEGI